MSAILARPKSLREVVEEHLCQKIISGQWTEGYRLPAISELSVDLNVSQTTIREAIQRLCSAGMLDVHQGLGTFVKPVPGWLRSRPEAWKFFLREQAILEIIEAREMLEVQIAGLAATRRTDQEVDDLKISLEKLKNAIDQDAPDYDKVDLALHENIWKASHNKTVLQMMLAVYGQLEEVIRIVAMNTVDMKKIFNLHVKVVEAISNGNPEDARSCMQDHFDSIREDLLLAAKQITNGKEQSI